MNPPTGLKKVPGYIFDGLLLGQGQFGKVYGARCENTNKSVAIKIISAPAATEVSIRSELNVLNKLSKSKHPNILNLLYSEVKDIEGNKQIFIVTERCDCDLQKYFEMKKTFPEEEIRLIAQQIASAFRVIRQENIVHRDLKLGNILINLDKSRQKVENIKVADFGFAKVLASSNAMMETYAGSPIYMAPEILHNNDRYSNKVDLWSIGIMLYILVTGSTPFQVQTVEQLKNCLRNNRIPEISRPVTSELKDLIRKLLVLEPERRIGWEEFFNHPWISISFDYVDNQRSYLREIIELAAIKASCFDSLPEALTLYFKYLKSLSDLYQSLARIDLSSFPSTRATVSNILGEIRDLYNPALTKAKQIVEHGRVEPVGVVEEMIFQRAIDLGKLGIVKEICKRYKESEVFYRKSIIILKGQLRETVDENSKEQLENFLDKFNHRLNHVEEKIRTAV